MLHELFEAAMLKLWGDEVIDYVNVTQVIRTCHVEIWSERIVYVNVT
jgi:hypothetical protein